MVFVNRVRTIAVAMLLFVVPYRDYFIHGLGHFVGLDMRCPAIRTESSG